MVSLLTRTLAVLAILTLLVLAFAYAAFSRRMRREAEHLVVAAREPGGGVISEAKLDGLPAPVRRYLRYAGVVGRPIPRTVRLEQAGTIRRTATEPSRPLEAVQYYSIDPPGFIWIATMRQNGVPLVRGRDRYADGRGRMQIKLGSLIDLVDARGEALDQGALVRYLSEMIWFPAAFLESNVHFDPIDDHNARVTISDRGRSVTGTLTIDDEGKLTSFSAQRYMVKDGGSTLETWLTPVTRYGEFEGLRLPVGAKAVWKLAGGDVEYIDLVITRLEYDVERVY
jgi:hypothetical protein